MKQQYKSKKEKVLNSKKVLNKKNIIIAATLSSILIIIAIIFLINNSSQIISAKVNKTTTDKFIKYSIKIFNNGKALHFEEIIDNVKVRYFIVKSKDGVIRAALDACDVCWRANMGYVQQNDEMICRNCGRKFNIKNINIVSGGCNPVPLKRTIKDDKLVISKDDLKDGVRYFNL